jgi:hypothetical protein
LGETAETDYITSDLQMSLLPAQIFYAGRVLPD